jgi:selenocysteine lyase/cysteine desulfurase
VPETPEFLSDGRKFEPGAPPTPGIYALAASLELLLSIGSERVAARIAACLAALAEELPRSGWTPVLFGGPPRSGILAARPPDGVSPHRVARLLGERGFEVSARQGFLRFSPHVSIEPDEAAAAAAELRKI